MRRETTPSIEPLFPEGTPCEVIDPDGKRMFDGFYFHFCKSVAFFANEDKPEDYAHVVLRREIVDWGLPEKFILAEVTPPHTIAAVGDTFDMETARAAVEAVKEQIPNTMKMLSDS